MLEREHLELQEKVKHERACRESAERCLESTKRSRRSEQEVAERAQDTDAVVSGAKALRDTEWEAFVAQQDAECAQAVKAEWRQTDEEWEAVVTKLKSTLQEERV